MLRLTYIANIRLPDGRAHAHQIMQMCEAFALEGADVRLLVGGDIGSGQHRNGDPWVQYGVRRNFEIIPVPCLDLSPLASRLPYFLRRPWSQVAWTIRTLTFSASVAVRLRREPLANVYSRDAVPLWLLARLWPRRSPRFFFEVHSISTSRIGISLRRRLAAQIGGMIFVTGHLEPIYACRGISPRRALIAHDGVRLERFAVKGSRAHWRARAGWQGNAFIIGYAGRFQTLGMEKGLHLLARAAAELALEASRRPIRLVLLGGPDEVATEIRHELLSRGAPGETLIHTGWARPDELPGRLRALDVSVIPFPATEHFAYAASPLKLFEYMASGTPIVASDLPAIAEVIQDGRNGLLVPPGNVQALAAALRRLRDDRTLGGRLARQAARDVMAYSWNVRATRILAMIEDSRAAVISI